MSKQEYIHQLKAKLKGLDEKEIEDAITYCEEYFDDAGEGNEEQVIKDLGTPGKFAAQLKAESIIREEETGTKKKNSAFRNFLDCAHWIVCFAACLSYSVSCRNHLIYRVHHCVKFIICTGGFRFCNHNFRFSSANECISTFRCTR